MASSSAGESSFSRGNGDTQISIVLEENDCPGNFRKHKLMVFSVEELYKKIKQKCASLHGLEASRDFTVRIDASHEKIEDGDLQPGVLIPCHVRFRKSIRKDVRRRWEAGRVNFVASSIPHRNIINECHVAQTVPSALGEFIDNSIEQLAGNME